jgi:murein DD-endopeptidase MepM/ murein hydrolase activator NlpD
MGRDTNGDGATEEGFPVRAIRAGVITGSFRDSNCNSNVTPGCDGSGNWVHIRHEDGTVAAYLHMQFHSVPVFTVGQSIAQGDTIGLVGNTGSSSAPHVHVDLRQFEVTPGGSAGPTIPFYFEDQNHLAVPWRPRKGDALLSTQP